MKLWPFVGFITELSIIKSRILWDYSFLKYWSCMKLYCDRIKFTQNCKHPTYVNKNMKLLAVITMVIRIQATVRHCGYRKRRGARADGSDVTVRAHWSMKPRTDVTAVFYFLSIHHILTVFSSPMADVFLIKFIV